MNVVPIPISQYFQIIDIDRELATVQENGLQ